MKPVEDTLIQAAAEGIGVYFSSDASAGTVDLLRTFDDYSGSPTQHTGPGWDNVTGLGTPTSAFFAAIS